MFPSIIGEELQQKGISKSDISIAFQAPQFFFKKIQKPTRMVRLLTAALLFTTLHLSAQDLSLFEKRTYVHEDGRTLPYRILYPENYDSSKEYPLVLFLHGAGERGDDNEKQLVHGVKTFLEPAHRTQFPCIVIAPQCPAEDYWSSVKVDRSNYPVGLDFDYAAYEETESLEMAIELTKKIMKEEAVDKDRVYITGLSMGGMGTFEAVYRYPKLFAAAAPVCGGGDADAYKKRHARIPFWIFHGEEDGVVEVEESRKMYKRLKALGAEVKYTEYPGVNHNSWENAYQEEEFLSWLFGQKR